MAQEQLGPSYFFIPLVLGPLNSLLWYVPSLMYTRGLGWRMHCGEEVTESSTNKRHHIHHPEVTLPVTVSATLLSITAGPITKLCAWGKEDSEGHVL